MLNNTSRIHEILRRVDHTLLSPTATQEQVRALCEEAICFQTASVCVPPCHVPFAVSVLGGRVRVCTVIGFPNGYATSRAKAFEAAEAVENGADEIDMVINLSYVKEQRYSLVQDEIALVRRACQGRILKVIVETSLLTEEEKKMMCHVVAAAGADFIKTSTGFAGGGATVEDIRLFAAQLPAGVKIKASGGISTLEQGWALMEAGASRLGASKLIRCAQEAAGREDACK